MFARSAGGGFRLRIEDLDPDRSRAEWEARQITALRDLGLDWDGPVLRQSERSEHYAQALAELEAAGRVYPCFCTRAEIRAAASAPHGESAGAAASPPHGESASAPASVPHDRPADAYPGTCRRLSATERTARLRAGDRHALRFDARGERVDFSDRLAGPGSVAVDDFVLRRSDGVFAYQLAVVVDDAAQGISQVVRGADLLDSIGRQVLLARALGNPEPAWVHVPLVLGPDGARLAKRHGSAAAPASPPETLAWLAASLGIPAAPGGSAARSAADLIHRFDPERIPSAPIRLSSGEQVG